MTRELIISLIMAISIELNVPPQFSLSIALEENPTLNPLAVNLNENGTYDRGIMQLNSASFPNIDWKDPETNIRAGVGYIRFLMNRPEINTYYGVAVSYNTGLNRLGNPPKSTIEYAIRVVNRYNNLMNGNAPVVVRRGV